MIIFPLSYFFFFKWKNTAQFDEVCHFLPIYFIYWVFPTLIISSSHRSISWYSRFSPKCFNSVTMYQIKLSLRNNLSFKYFIEILSCFRTMEVKKMTYMLKIWYNKSKQSPIFRSKLEICTLQSLACINEWNAQWLRSSSTMKGLKCRLPFACK